MVKPHPPRCETCRTSANVHWVPRPGQIPGAAGAHRWLCGDCEYAELHSVVARRDPFRKPKQPQSETLW